MDFVPFSEPSTNDLVKYKRLIPDKKMDPEYFRIHSLKQNSFEDRYNTKNGVLTDHCPTRFCNDEEKRKQANKEKSITNLIWAIFTISAIC